MSTLPCSASPCSVSQLLARRPGSCGRLRCNSLALRASKQPLPVFIEDSGTQSFFDWARSAGIACGKLRPATFDGVRGLAANSDIAFDDLLVSVPRTAALTLPPKQRCPCPDFVTPTYWDAAPWFVKLGVRLLHEQRRGPASPYYAWLQQLPRSVASPVNWSRELVQQLQYAHLIHKVTEQQQEWSALYDRFTEGVVDRTSTPSQQEFFRALSLVRSRTFSGPYVASTLADRLRLAGLVAVLVVVNTAAGGELSQGLGAAAAVFLFNIIYELVLSNKLRQYAMCPVIDLLNHSSSNTTEVSYDYPRDAFLVAAGAAYSPGQQVFISYGAQTNDSLMQMYGFAEPDNPHDAYVMTSLLKWLEQLQPTCQARLDRLNRDGLLPALQEVVITRTGFGPATLQALRYLLAPADALAGNSSSSSGGLPAGPSSRYELPADAETEEKLALVLVHACQQELAVLGTTNGSGSRSGSNGRGSSSSSSGGSRKAGGAAGGGSVSVAEAQAAAAAFRVEKQKVLLACLGALTGSPAAAETAVAAADGGGSGSAAAGSPPAEQPAAAGR